MAITAFTPVTGRTVTIPRTPTTGAPAKRRRKHPAGNAHLPVFRTHNKPVIHRAGTPPPDSEQQQALTAVLERFGSKSSALLFVDLSFKPTLSFHDTWGFVGIPARITPLKTTPDPDGMALRYCTVESHADYLAKIAIAYPETKAAVRDGLLQVKHQLQRQKTELQHTPKLKELWLRANNQWEDYQALQTARIRLHDSFSRLMDKTFLKTVPKEPA